MTTSTLRTLAVRTSVLAVLASLSLTPVMAQNPGAPQVGAAPFGTFSFDEKGSSLLNNGPNPNPFSVGGSGGIQFVLPGLVTPGQVLISSQSDNGDSDLLTFSNLTNSAGTPYGAMLYESLIADVTDTDRADVLALSSLVPFTGLFISEIGADGNNNFSYTAGGNTYFGWSDGYLVQTPEPSSFVLSGLALAALANLAYRRRKARTNMKNLG